MAKKIALLPRILLFTLVALMISACASPATQQAPSTTSVGTPRNETLIFQTFDGKTNNPDSMNPLMANYAIWRGFRELGWGYLWEMDTATGKSYGELAADLPEVLNDQHTQFRVKLKEGIYWSDGIEFTSDDVIYTLDTYFQSKGKLTYFGVSAITNYVKSYKKVDNYTFEVETLNPSYDLATVMGVYTWGSAFNIVPKHIFEKQADLAAFRNTKPVTLGPYVVKSFDPNGFWQLWEKRPDWQRSSWGWMGEPKPKYVLYKDFGTEDTRTLAFIQNQYDVDTFMSPDSIKGAAGKNSAISTFSKTMPYNDMGDACSYGLLINQGKAPLDKAEVRWALALSMDLQSVGINSMNGQFKASALPMPDTHILRPLYFDPLLSWLNEFKLADGYQPFNPNFSKELTGKLKTMGMADSELPQGDQEASQSFGVGWWKNDPAQAEKLLNSVGIKKNAEGFYTLPNGNAWELEFVIPSDWNKVMQRIGFSIADSWRKAGIKVNARQVDNGEFGNVQNTNSKLTVQLNWNSCVFNANYLNSWRSIQPQFLKEANSTEAISGNPFRWNNEAAFSLIKSSSQMDQTNDQFRQNGVEIAKEFIKDMAYINIMNIPTTIPTNSHYWQNFPKQDNYYAAPYSWWSSAKNIVLKVQPSGQK